MKLEIYKSIQQYGDTEVLYYAIRNVDLPPHTPCITIRIQDADWSLYSQMFPETGFAPHYEESSFLDLLVVTGIPQSQIEYIFTNLDFESHTISIQPRQTGHTMMSLPSQKSGPNPITTTSSFGHAQPVQTWPKNI